MTGYEQEQCDKTGPSMCDYPAAFEAGGYTPHEAYTLFTIFAIWQWYESIYEAIGNADTSASGRIGKIVNTINPKVPQSHVLGDFLQALTALTPLISAPARIVAVLGKDIGKSIIETALRQTPGVVKQLHPTGTLTSQILQANDLFDGLTTIKTTYQQNVSNALSMIQSNFSNFAVFAADGNFIAPRADLQANTENLTLTLETYVISQCLQANNIFITLNRDTNPYEFARNSSLSSDLIDCDYYDEYGVCSAWWYDPGTNAAFGLANYGDPVKNHYDLMQTIFSSGWTTGAALFLGAKACADRVAVFGGDKTPAINTDTMEPQCISNLQVCVFDTKCEGTDENCEFTGEYGWEGCKPQKNYLNCGCAGNTEYTDVCLPAVYLGPLMTTTRDDLLVCRA